MMKKYFFIIFLFLMTVFNLSCVLMSTQENFGVSVLRYEKSISYSVTAEWVEGKFLHIDKGMAVVVMMRGNECILATAKHIVQNNLFVTVSPLDSMADNSEKIKAKVIYVDNLEDVAFLSFTTRHKHVAPMIMLNENVLIGKTIIAFRGLSNGYRVTKGNIIDFWKLDNRKFMVAEMPNEKGFSGSGAFDSAGNLVGLIIGKAKDERLNITYLVSGSKIVSAFKRYL